MRRSNLTAPTYVRTCSLRMHVVHRTTTLSTLVQEPIAEEKSYNFIQNNHFKVCLCDIHIDVLQCYSWLIISQLCIIAQTRPNMKKSQN